ncbi:MAG: hypothetical protein PHF29_05420 [Candidatus Riflebacteria bacterium]|nr:hypothetical protein [Candidatus Riflebacteria bacterium]
MNNPKKSNKKYSDSATLIELLVCLAILSTALYPVVYMLQLSRPKHPSSQNEYLATLLAHHATETLTAKRALSPDYLPEIVSNSPVVVHKNSATPPHTLFDSLMPDGSQMNETNDSEVFWAFKPFTFSIDNYIADNNFYKVICQVNYTSNNMKSRIYFDKLISLNGSGSQANGNDSYE